MIAPGAAFGKGSNQAICGAKNAKWRIGDHELVKKSHNNAPIPSIAGHEVLG